MFRLLVLLGLAACSMAAVDHCCSAGDKAIVVKQWRSLWKEESSSLKLQFGRLALLKLVEKNPAAKALFTGVGVDKPTGGEFSAHSLRVMNGLDMIISLLPDQDALDAALDHLAYQHEARKGVKKEYFASMAGILNDALEVAVDNYDTMAWKSCFRGIFKKLAGRQPA